MPDTVRQAPITDDRHRCRCDTGSCSSSPVVSPSHSFKRSKSTFYLLDRRTSPPPGRLLQPQDTTIGWSAKQLFWKSVKTLVSWPWINVLLLRLPSFWLCFWIQSAWKCARIPLVVSNRVLRLCSTRRRYNNKKNNNPKCEQQQHRTVLINGGSTVQALHLARNFYLTGARVIVCEIEGLAELSSFSMAVDNHYIVPRPSEDNCVQYVDALRAIVEKERVGYYVPTGTTVSAYYDAVAKSHLELLGCRCCTPGLDGVSILNDMSEVLLKCEFEGLAVPKHLRVASKEDIVKLYDNVSFRPERHFIVNVGLSGSKVRHRLKLPANRKSLTLPGPVSEECPWLLVQICPGSYYTTCTTVRHGRVIGNLTCNVRDDGDSAGRNELVDEWVTHFVSTLSATFDAILTFRICVTPSRKVIPLDCHVGVPVTYMSYTSNFETILYPPCEHVRQSLSPEIQITGRYYAPELLYKTITQMTTINAVQFFVNTMLTKSEMIFIIWDPLPFLAYYNLQQITNYVNNVLDKALMLASGHKNNKYTTF